MKILIVRHADPDYTVDGLTEVGRIEAELLSEKLCKENITAVYCSPLGRAQLTAKPTLEKLGMTGTTCDWLREFDYTHIELPYERKFDAPWDILPQYMGENPVLYNVDEWYKTDIIKDTDVHSCYLDVCTQFDRLLEKHGYERSSVNYKAVRPNHDTILLFCHYGVGSVLLSHIMNCSPYSLWQNAVLLPSSVTTVHTEERREGIASLRVCGIGDLSHLYAKDVSPSFSARFCECFTDDTRHS